MQRRGEGVTISSIFFCLTGLKRNSLYRKDSVFQEISGIAKKLWIGGDISRFPVEIFMSHRAEKFRDGIPLFLRKFQVSKSFLDEKGGITFFRRNLQVSQCRKFSLASLEGFRRFGCRKFFCITGGIIFFRRKFWASQCWKFLWASLQNFRNFGVLKIFIHNRGYDVFPSQSFCMTVLNYFIGEHCGVSEKFFYRIFPCIGGGASRFCQSLLFHRTERKLFVKETICFPEKFWYRNKLMDKSGHFTIFSRKFYVSQCRKFRRGILLFLKNFLVSKISFWIKRGVSRFSTETFWSHSAEKIRGHPLKVLENFGRREILFIIGGFRFFRRKVFVWQFQNISLENTVVFQKKSFIENFRA